MRKIPSSRISNVFHQYQTEKEQNKSRAKLLSKLWLKASGFYDSKYKDIETNDNYLANISYDIQFDVHFPWGIEEATLLTRKSEVDMEISEKFKELQAKANELSEGEKYLKQQEALLVEEKSKIEQSGSQVLK